MAGVKSKENGKLGGRPVGSTTRPRVSVIEHFSPDEIAELFADLKAKAKSDSKVAIWLAEQMTGKAPQAMSIDMGGNITISFDASFTSSKTNSSE